MKQKTILIIDPIVSNNYLASSFKAMGITIIAAYMFKKSLLQDYQAVSEGLFSELIFCESTLELESIIYDRHIDYVVNGEESSLHITETVASKVTPQFSNDPATTHYRNNKMVMHEVLARHNINNIRQIKFNRLTDDINKIYELLMYPCFIKPLQSAGSTGAKKVHNRSELDTYFQNIDFKTVLAHCENGDDFLICDFIAGTEYFIDSFSINGEHHISSIQKYHREFIDNAPIYRYCELETSDEIKKKITDYITCVLTALEFKHGFAHSEVFLKENGEPVLIEVNPRIGGEKGMTNYTADFAGLYTQPELLAHHVFGTNLTAKIANPLPIRRLVLFNFKNNPLIDLNSHLGQYNSVKSVMQVKPAGYINKANQYEYTLLDVVAFVLCYNNDSYQFELDCTTILEQDKIGFNYQGD